MDADTKIQELQKQLAERKAEIADLKGQLSYTASHLETEVAARDEAEAKIASLKQDRDAWHTRWTAARDAQDRCVKEWDKSQESLRKALAREEWIYNNTEINFIICQSASGGFYTIPCNNRKELEFNMPEDLKP